jgi:anti-anti-sigma factor
MNDGSGVIRISIDGELSIFTVAAIRERLLQALAEGADVEAGLGGVTEIDTAGVQLMLAAGKQAAAQGKTLRFADASPVVQDILNLCGLDVGSTGVETPGTGDMPQ